MSSSSGTNGRRPRLEGRTLGKFDVIREIGRGAMGTVYLGHDPFTDRDVAIKVAHADQLNDPRQGSRYRKMFFNEAKVAGRLRHPNIVEVYDAGVSGETCFIVMEYVAGGQTLYAHIRPESLLPMEDAVRIIFKCARALDYAHRKGVIHRDIKPRNILLTDEFDVKIGDFSIALTFGTEATTTQVHGYVGSPLYMSPEQVREDAITNQSDLFTLGVVLYELLSGKHPFHGDSLASIISKITEQQHVPVAELRHDVPPVLAHIVERCLQKAPSDRYRTGLDLAADLSLVFSHIELMDEELSSGDKFAMVSKLKFFQDFSEPEIWEVINASGWYEFVEGAEIITEGDVENSFYVIVNGGVEVLKGERVVDRLHTGDCFGEMGFIAGRERTASIIARTPVSALKVRATLIERASLHCQLRFHKVFLNTLVERLSLTTARVSAPAPPG
jgi:serine/threonine protein kinase